jgi:superfamily II DNA or RNA helicase
VKIQDETVFYKPINFKFAGKLRDYQEKAINEVLKNEDGVLCSPTGSGKTVMAINLISLRKQPTLIIVHTTELLHQWIDRINTFLSIPKKEIGVVGAGKETIGKQITIALIQTLNNSKMPDIGFLIVDECHRIPSTTFTKTVKKFTGKYILGLSATPYRNDSLSQLITWYAGPIRYKIKSKKLIENGSIVRIKPVIRQTDFQSKLYDPALNYAKLIKEIVLDEDRNSFITDDIINLVKTDKSVCLVLSDRKQHCDLLYNSLISKDSNLRIEILTGNKKQKERKAITQQVENNEIDILIATSQLIGEGFDCKNLTNLFLTTPVKYFGRVIQYIGRVLRPDKGKDKAIIYDYFDVNIGCLHNSFKSRQKVYEKLS